MNKFISVWDPKGEVIDGTLFDAQSASMKSAQGVVLLPTDTSVHRDHAHGGYAKRSWGPGLPADDLPGMRYFSPIALYGEPIHTKFSWAARIRQAAQSDVSGAVIGINGQCSLHPLPGQRGGMQLSYAVNEMPLALNALGPMDEHGGWTLKGTANVHLAGAGFYAFALAGAVMGIRVMWVAATFAKE